MMAHGVPALLIAAAAGYWVLGQAEHQKGSVRKLGQYLGLAIIAVSVIGAACKTYAVIQCYRAGMCPAPMKMGCPYSGSPQVPKS